MIRTAIIGCGRAGSKRAHAIARHSPVNLLCDKNLSFAERLSWGDSGTICASQWTSHADRFDAAVVAVETANLYRCAIELIEARKHVLVEKPGALIPDQIEHLFESAAKYNVVCRIGYNLAFHPSIIEAHEIVARGDLGHLMLMRAQYGHGGRRGYETEWRSKLPGGGVLLDLGSHLVNLALQFFLFSSGNIAVSTLHWSAEVDDNAFILLRSTDGETAQLHASSTEWKNSFSLTLIGRSGEIKISGLGGSYGKESLTFYHMGDRLGVPPEETTKVWSVDDSLSVEWRAFITDIHNGASDRLNRMLARETLWFIDAKRGYLQRCA